MDISLQVMMVRWCIGKHDFKIDVSKISLQFKLFHQFKVDCQVKVFFERYLLFREGINIGKLSSGFHCIFHHSFLEVSGLMTNQVVTSCYLMLDMLRNKWFFWESCQFWLFKLDQLWVVVFIIDQLFLISKPFIFIYII